MAFVDGSFVEAAFPQGFEPSFWRLGRGGIAFANVPLVNPALAFPPWSLSIVDAQLSPLDYLAPCPPLSAGVT